MQFERNQYKWLNLQNQIINIAFTPSKAEQQLWGMELQEEEAKQD